MCFIWAGTREMKWRNSEVLRQNIYRAVCLWVQPIIYLHWNSLTEASQDVLKLWWCTLQDEIENPCITALLPLFCPLVLSTEPKTIYRKRVEGSVSCNCSSPSSRYVTGRSLPQNQRHKALKSIGHKLARAILVPNKFA